ncbi:RNA polymerase sigma-70 factor (ECF subfamily) [Paucibacter oligotrophus]|uniref:RNA polymerase sigma-70 factor (ECF subfamily) n=1 Tax=Roseateles oligotrophus TaxID=1769250 RepID=A0A840LE03_9BURK|nr:RNA polymerase sigma-70 factor (ECF subfamily) [Roseateles oligotrophus]
MSPVLAPTPPAAALGPQLGQLYAQHHGWLLAWLRGRLRGDGQQAADLAQDTFMRLLLARDALDTLAGLQTPRAWLCTTARHLLVDRARRQAIELAYLQALSQANTQHYQPSPEQELIAVQTLAQIGAALEGAAPKAGQAFVLHYLEGLTQQQVAARLGVSGRMVQKYLVQVLSRCALAA